MIIGIDHGYYAIKTRNCSFLAGITPFGDREPYTRQNVLTFGGCFFVCGSGRQPIQRDKTANDNYFLLTLAAIAKEIEARGVPRECGVTIATGLPLTSYGREKPAFRKYLLRNAGQPTEFGYEGKKYRITIEDVLLFPQGFTALMTQPDLLVDEPSMLLLDIGGWTVDLMRIDNGRPIIDTCHSLEFGMIRCIDEVRELVRQNTGLSLTDAQIEQVLAGRQCSLEETVHSLIREQGRLYTERLLSAVLEAGFDYHALPVVMMGGGASVVSRHVRPSDGLCRTVTLLDDTVSTPKGMSALWPRFGAMTRKGEAPAIRLPPQPARPGPAPRLAALTGSACGRAQRLSGRLHRQGQRSGCRAKRAACHAAGRTWQNPNHRCARGTQTEEGGAQGNTGLFLCLAAGRTISPTLQATKADRRSEQNVRISHRTQQKLYCHEQLPPA